MNANAFKTVNNQKISSLIIETYINHIPAETLKEIVLSRITTTTAICTVRILNTSGMGTP